MLPTPDTSHVSYNHVYEPAEDSFLLLDTLSSATETAFLSNRFPPHHHAPPLILEVGPGSGVVIGFLTANATPLFGHQNILTFAIDVNRFACSATKTTSQKAVAETGATVSGLFLDCLQGDLVSPLRAGQVDVLVFNPPYVPTDVLPAPLIRDSAKEKEKPTFEEESVLLELAYAGGKDGMETTDRLLGALPEVLSERGVAYVLLCAGNRPEEVKERIRGFEGGVGGRWKAETVGVSGRQAGWERLQIVRIWREVE